jgi:hypothetical protein
MTLHFTALRTAKKGRKNLLVSTFLTLSSRKMMMLQKHKTAKSQGPVPKTSDLLIELIKIAS